MIQTMASDFPPKHRPHPDLLEDYRSLAWLLDALFREFEEEIRPGVKTSRFDAIAAAFLKNEGVESSFKSYRGYPAFVSTSVNQEVLNTIPSARKLCDGDLLKLQAGIKDGVGHSYQAWTYAVGTPRAEDASFLSAGKLALNRAVPFVKAGMNVLEISRTIQSTLESAGYSPNEKYVGHGMGRRQHELPQVHCYVPEGSDAIAHVLRRGQILSIQVIAHQGKRDCLTVRDGWSVETRDQSRALTLSQIVVATENGPDVLTPMRR